MGCQKLIYRPKLSIYSSKKLKRRNGLYIYNYRYGFNGKENTDEISGEGNSVDFGARIYDGRLGKWLSCDPFEIKYPYLSPFVYVANNLLIFIDPSGALIVFANDGGISEAAYLKLYEAADIETKVRLNKLAQSSLVVHIDANVSNSEMTDENGIISGGSTNYNFVENRIEVKINGGAGEADRVGAMGDELAEASMFLEGEVGFGETNGGKAFAIGNDRGDEAKSWRAAIKARRSLSFDLNESEKNFEKLDNMGGADDWFDNDPVGKLYSLPKEDFNFKDADFTNEEGADYCKKNNLKQIAYCAQGEMVKVSTAGIEKKDQVSSYSLKSHDLPKNSNATNDNKEK